MKSNIAKYSMRMLMLQRVGMTDGLREGEAELAYDSLYGQTND